jgi:hypothetical protein
MPAFRTIAVGAQFHPGAREALERLAEGDIVSLVRDPTNQYDPYAVRVLNLEDQMLGFIPMTMSRLVSDLLDSRMARPEARVFTGKKGPELAIDYNLKGLEAEGMTN